MSDLMGQDETGSPWSYQSMIRRAVPRGFRNLLRSPADTLRWVHGEVSAAMGGTASIDLPGGIRIRCHPSSMPSFKLFQSDEDSIAELQSFVAHCESGMRIFDLGAHFGFFSLVALATGGCNARVAAVEPSTVAYHVLTQNLGRQHADGRICCLRAAAGGENGDLSMLTTGPSSAHYMVLSPPHRSDAIRVPEMTLASIASQAGWIPSHIKIDVEGCEYEIIHGGLEELRCWRPVLFLELHCRLLRERGKDPRAVLSLLRSVGYQQFLWRSVPMPPAEAIALDIARLVCLPS